MAELGFTKLPADRRTTVFIGPSGAGLGVTDVDAPLEEELNNDPAGSGMLMASPSISWNDWGFGTQASEVTNEPSLADAASYEEFGQTNYGGDISYWLPQEYDDDSNLHSLVYDLTDLPGMRNDIAVRIDGDLETTVPAEDGQFASVYRVQGVSETNPFTPGESKRRTVGYWNKSSFSHWTVIGGGALTAIPATTPYTEGRKARLRISQGGRDITNDCTFTSSDATVVQVYAGGFYEVTGEVADTATITVTKKGATSLSVSVTVS